MTLTKPGLPSRATPQTAAVGFSAHVLKGKHTAELEKLNATQGDDKINLLEQRERDTVPPTTAPKREILKLNGARRKTHAEKGKWTQASQKTSALGKQKTYCVLKISVLPMPTHIPKDADAAQANL